MRLLTVTGLAAAMLSGGVAGDVLAATGSQASIAQAARPRASIARAATGPRASIAQAATGPRASVARVGAAPPRQRVALVLPLRANLSGLERFATAVTTPGSPQFGNYESITTLASRFGAGARTRARVVRYLRAVGASGVKIDATGLFADATMTTRAAARVFATPIAQFRTAQGARFIGPTAAARLPPALRGVATAVIGLDNRPLQRSSAFVDRAGSLARVAAHAAFAQPTSAESQVTGVPAGCPQGIDAGGFTPNQYLTAYDFMPLRDAGMDGQGERVALIEVDGFNYNDIQTFAQCFGFGIPALRAFGVGVSHALPPGGESTLDLEVLDAAAPGLKGIDVYEANATAANTLRALTAPLQNRGSVPQVISASLGLCEPDVVAAVGPTGIRTTEASLEMAAASGITVLAASGDQGSADCTTFDGTPLDRLAVNYPASSPWVTGVGGTNLTLGSANQITSQVVWNDTTIAPGAAGGGGTSKIFTRPSYQRGTVRPNARFVPDVSMLSDIAPGYAVYCTASTDCLGMGNSNPWLPVGGTSAATPLLAGGLALVDQDLREHGHEQLGFVNPLLYELGRSSARSRVFRDVTQYGNDVGPYIPGNGRPLGCCTAGPGYDRASGWGSVDLANFATATLLAEPPTIAVSIPKRQRPVKRKGLLARVRCGAACWMGAQAEVKIGRGKPFKIESRTYMLDRSGAKRIPLPFTAGQLRAVRSALARHERVVVTVVGVVFGGRSGKKILAISGSRRMVVG